MDNDDEITAGHRMRAVAVTLWNCDRYWHNHLRSVLRPHPAVIASIKGLEEFSLGAPGLAYVLLCELPNDPEQLFHSLWDAERCGAQLTSIVMINREAMPFWRELRQFGCSVVLPRPVDPAVISELIIRTTGHMES